jgi:NAD+ synthase
MVLKPKGTNMAFTKDVLKIDPEGLSTRLADWIRETVTAQYRRKGIVVGLSGGLDSATSAALSVKALGADKVVGVLLPEKDSNPISRQYGRALAERLGIECFEVGLTRMLEAFGVYEKRDRIVRKMFPSLKPPYIFRLVLPPDLLDRDRLNVYHIEVLLPDKTTARARVSHDDYLELMAANDIKQRLRMTQLYYEAERRYYIVCGTTNYPEAIQGFYVKYGDGGVDIEPLQYLYKQQVRELARHLGVPREILERTPSPDTYSFPVSDADFYLLMPYEILDYVIYAEEHGIPHEEVASALGLTVEQVARAAREMVRKREASKMLRELPPAPRFTS